MITRLTCWSLLVLLGVGLVGLPATIAWAQNEDIGGGEADEKPADKTDEKADETDKQIQETEKDADEKKLEEKKLDEEPATRPADDPGRGKWILPLVIGMIILWIWMGRKPRKAQKKRKEMLGNLKKGDKITSIGGIVGTVLDVSEDDVTVKIDEATNTRMKFARWAVRNVGGPAEETEGERK